MSKIILENSNKNCLKIVGKVFSFGNCVWTITLDPCNIGPNTVARISVDILPKLVWFLSGQLLLAVTL